MTTTDDRYEKLAALAARSGQDHVLAHWDALDSSARNALLDQLAEIDFAQVDELRTSRLNGAATDAAPNLSPVKPVSAYRTAADRERALEMRKIGERALKAGEIGAVLVAGGQGSRLGFEGPKGIFPIGPVTGKSLFQLHAEKILALCRRHDTRIPWYIMTSQANHEQTEQYFRENGWFGLPKEDVILFEQGMMPALDNDGRFLMDAPGRIFMNPDGHGGIVRALERVQAIAGMQARNVRHLFYFQVDNALVDICDPVFMGYHIHEASEISSKVCAKRDAHEKVGVVGRIDGRLGVIEYSDLGDDEKIATDENGELLFSAGNIAVHGFSVDFLERIAASDASLPWHVAHKKIPHLDENGTRVTPDAPNGFKFERFIFDALAFAERGFILEVDRATEFGPVKNAEGEDSPLTTRVQLSQLYGDWLKAAGLRVAEPTPENGIRLEISPLFALDKQEFVARFKSAGEIPRAFYIG